MFWNQVVKAWEGLKPDLLAIFLIPAGLAALAHTAFFHYSAWIWSFVSSRPDIDFVPWVRWQLSPRDGIELFVLLFLAILMASMSCLLFDRFISARNHLIRKAGFIVAVISAVILFQRVGFFLPHAGASSGTFPIVFAAAVAVFTAALWFFGERHRWLAGALGVLTAAVCFTPVVQISYLDYSHILGPAWKIANGVGFRDTYTQYDYFPSLVVALWMKLGLDIGWVRIIGQGAFFLLFAGLYFFAREFFLEKKLAFVLIISLLIVRVYGCQDDPVVMLQSTPLRLDLWLLLLALAYWKGLEHWSVGAALGVLIILHHAFGLIYSMSYVLSVSALLIAGIVDRKAFSDAGLGKLGARFGRNIFLILLAELIYNIFFKPEAAWGAARFMQYGIGFIPIAKTSFYWYVFSMFGMAAILLWQCRLSGSRESSAGDSKVAFGGNRFQSGVFLLALAIGNSIYFFGRSEEYNIINISTSLLLLLFCCIDMARLRFLAARPPKTVPWPTLVVSLSIIFILSFAYAGEVHKKALAQYSNIKAGRFFLEKPPFSAAKIRQILVGTEKAIFLSGWDVYYYYDGGYVPRDFFSYTLGWIIQADLIKHLKDKLEEGYFVVVPTKEAPIFMSILYGLRSAKLVRHSDFLIFVPNSYGLREN